MRFDRESFAHNSFQLIRLVLAVAVLCGRGSRMSWLHPRQLWADAKIPHPNGLPSPAQWEGLGWGCFEDALSCETPVVLSTPTPALPTALAWQVPPGTLGATRRGGSHDP